MTFNFGGLAGGFAQGVQIGQNLNEMLKQDAISKVREQGIAEARAAQAAQTPAVTDQGDMQNLTSTPQASPDPNAAPVNTDLAAVPALQPATGGLAGSAATAPADPNAPLSSTPQASADPNASPAAAGLAVTRGKRFQVAGTDGFDTADEAHAYVAKNTPSLYDIMRKTMVPKMQETYLQQGDLDKAAAIEKWSQDEDGRDYMKKYSKAVLASQAGDWNQAVDIMHDLHKGFNDGFTISDKSDVKDASGNVVGKKVTYTNDQTGETKTEVMDPKALVMMGMPGLAPDKAFELTYSTQKAADAAAAREAADTRNDTRTAARQGASQAAIAAREAAQKDKEIAAAAALEDKKSTNRIAETAAEAQIKSRTIGPEYKAKLTAQVESMRQYGMSESDIQDAIPALVGADNTKKTTDPTERRAIIATTLAEKNPVFLSMKPEEQKAKIDQIMDSAGVDSNVKTPRRTAGTPVPAAAAGIPQAKAAKAKGMPVWNPTTNTMEYR